MLGRRLVIGFIAATLAAGGMAAAAVAPSAAAPAAGDWSRPARVWSAPAGTSAPVDLGQVVDSRGVVTATWETSARGIWRVMASRLGSNGWSKPVTVFRAQAGATELDVRTAAGPADEVVVAVAALGGGGVKMSAARFSAGSWSPAVALGGSSYWSQSFSEETSGGRTCNPGMYVAAVKCSGSYCDNVSLLCVQGARPWGTCSWTNSFSEEQGAGLCPAGTAMAGARCTGSYCDNMSLYCCRPY